MQTKSYESLKDTYLVEFVTKIYRIDIVAFQIREHDDLGHAQAVSRLVDRVHARYRARTKKTIVNNNPAAISTAKRKSHPIFSTYVAARGQRVTQFSTGCWHQSLLYSLEAGGRTCTTHVV